MTTYHKIQSIFKRDPDNNHKTFLSGQYTRWEFEYLKHAEWIGTEKIHGMNMRIIWDGKTVKFRGKSDSANIPGDLLQHLMEKYTNELMEKVFGTEFEEPMVIYGEGCGPGIQKGGAGYSSEKTFIMFDAYIRGFWLSDEDMRSVGMQLDAQVTPIVFKGKLRDAIWLCEKGFESYWGPDGFEAEGLVLRPALELRTQDGQRVITKIKCADFPKVEAPNA